MSDTEKELDLKLAQYRERGATRVKLGLADIDGVLPTSIGLPEVNAVLRTGVGASPYSGLESPSSGTTRSRSPRRRR